MAFKCQPIGIDSFFHNANGSLYAFCLGSCLWNVSPVIASCWTSCKASFNQRFQCCLIVSSYFYRQPSNTNLIQNRCSWLHVTFFVTTTNHHANHPSVNHQQDQNFPMFPCYKKEISKTVGCFMLMTLLAGVRHFLRLFLQERWPHFLDSQCCRRRTWTLAQVQTSSQVKISKTFSTVQCRSFTDHSNLS